MPKTRMSDDQWLEFIKECRSSGLTDKDWCMMHEIHPSTLYKAIKRLRKKACEPPTHFPKSTPLKQEVALIASVDENGILTPACTEEPQISSDIHQSTKTYVDSNDPSTLETTACITMPSGIKVELSNSASAATIRTILCALQPV